MKSSISQSQPGDMFNAFKAKQKKHKMKKKNWIAGAIKKPGALHAEMGVAQGKKIPAKKLASAAKKGGKLGKRARLAETLKSFKHKKGAKKHKWDWTHPFSSVSNYKAPVKPQSAMKAPSGAGKAAKPFVATYGGKVGGKMSDGSGWGGEKPMKKGKKKKSSKKMKTMCKTKHKHSKACM